MVKNKGDEKQDQQRGRIKGESEKKEKRSTMTEDQKEKRGSK